MFSEDDKEVKEIMGQVINYFMRISFDDLTIGSKEVTESLEDFEKEIVRICD